MNTDPQNTKIDEPVSTIALMAQLLVIASDHGLPVPRSLDATSHTQEGHAHHHATVHLATREGVAAWAAALGMPPADSWPIADGWVTVRSGCLWHGWNLEVSAYLPPPSEAAPQHLDAATVEQLRSVAS
jgi:hypothetical protein